MKRFLGLSLRRTLSLFVPPRDAGGYRGGRSASRRRVTHVTHARAPAHAILRLGPAAAANRNASCNFAGRRV
jgi:hypothetical protein